MKIHQFVHTLSYGDAISGEALAIQRLFRGRGIESEIYSVHAHEKVEEFVRNWQLFAEDLAVSQQQGISVAAILHYSIASPLNQLLLDREGITRGIIYHNLTPTSWFRSYNARVTNDLIAGRDELPQLLACADMVWADSHYNKSELVELGRNDVEVLPLLLDLEKWSEPANRGIAAALKGEQKVNLLHVGRLAPNKCVEDIIKAFYFYHHKINKKSLLWLIGSDIDTEIYSFELRRIVDQLRLKQAVKFVGSVSNCELRAFYENSDAYLCMSEHEGFCVPLLEAMHCRLPIIAYNSSAVGETLGDGGIILEQKNPGETAELINMLVEDQALREELIERGLKRVAQFSEAAFNQQLEEKVIAPLRQVVSSSLENTKQKCAQY